MNTVTRTATISLAALMMVTGAAEAGARISLNNKDPHDSISDSVQGRPNIEIHDTHYEMPQLNSEGLNDAVLGRDGGRKLVLQGGIRIALDCDVGGNDLMVANLGSADLPAGTRLKWSVKRYGAQGYVQLRHGLAAGAEVTVADVLSSSAKPGTKCSVRPVGL